MFLASAMWFLPAALEPRTNDDPGESNNPKATAHSDSDFHFHFVSFSSHTTTNFLLSTPSTPVYRYTQTHKRDHVDITASTLPPRRPHQALPPRTPTRAFPETSRQQHKRRTHNPIFGILAFGHCNAIRTSRRRWCRVSIPSLPFMSRLET